MTINKKYTFEEINSLPVLLRNPRILLIGGGLVALQKAQVLIKNKIEFRIITIEAVNKLKVLKKDIIYKRFTKNDLQNFNIVIDATGNKDVNKKLLKEKSKRFFLLNTVDIPSQCDFYFSALINYGKLKIAVSSDGASPTISQTVRKKIANFLPKDLASITDETAKLRKNNIIDIKSAKANTNKIFGKVYFVGAGTGNPDLLTVKAYKLLQTCDVVLYDALITKEILDIIPDSIKKIFVGKPYGSKKLTQEQINNIIVENVLKGFRVVRLKSGDPNIFGRLFEELSFIKGHHINYEVVPGISSAVYGPISENIPLTARGYSSNISIVSGSLEKNKFNYDWIDILKIKKHTTVVLMGLKRIPELVEHAIKARVDSSLPVAIISNIDRVNQQKITTTLNNLEEDSKGAASPAILVFGETVNLAKVLEIPDVKYANVI